jgi:hypothetical protein
MFFSSHVIEQSHNTTKDSQLAQIILQTKTRNFCIKYLLQAKTSLNTKIPTDAYQAL